MGEAVRLGELDLSVAIYPDNAREIRFGGEPI